VDAQDEVTLDGAGVIEVVGVERGEREDAASANRDFGALFEPLTKLLAHERVDECSGRVIAGNGLLRGGVELIGGAVEAEGAQDIGERERRKQVRRQGR